MAQCTADFELGTNGNTIATGDTGSLTAWNSVTISSGDTVTYDTAHAAHGVNAAKFAFDATTSNAHIDWTTAFGTLTDHYGRVYVYFTANPSATIVPIMQCGTSSGSVRGCRIDINTTGTLRIVDNVGAAAIGNTTNSIALNQWVRIEWHVIHSATVGQVELKLFNTPDSSSVTETLTSAANLNTLANANGILFGNIGGALSTTFWMDDIVAGAVAYPGPAVVTSTSNPALSCSGSTAFLRLKGLL